MPCPPRRPTKQRQRSTVCARVRAGRYLLVFVVIMAQQVHGIPVGKNRNEVAARPGRATLSVAPVHRQSQKSCAIHPCARHIGYLEYDRKRQLTHGFLKRARAGVRPTWSQAPPARVAVVARASPHPVATAWSARCRCQAWQRGAAPIVSPPPSLSRSPAPRRALHSPKAHRDRLRDI